VNGTAALPADLDPDGDPDLVRARRAPSGRPRTRRSSRSRHLTGALVALALLVGGFAGCSGSEADDAASPSTTAMTVPGSIPVHEGPREPLEGFEEITITVTTEDGRTLEWCLLLATTPETHQQGLMYVTDPSLGGYDGMLFRFETDSTGGFWMKNTRLPLSIAYLDADGAIVSTADMDPCPDGTERCPGYPADGPYRDAVEVVQGRLDDLGIEGEARVRVADEPGCAAPGASAA
jgi:uncharacterized protein